MKIGACRSRRSSKTSSYTNSRGIETPPSLGDILLEKVKSESIAQSLHDLCKIHYPTVAKGLALHLDESILVADSGNHALRRVTMARVVSTVAGNCTQGCADGEGAAARFRFPLAVVVDRQGTIVLADSHNHRLCLVLGRRVTMLAGGSVLGDFDWPGTVALFDIPTRLAGRARAFAWASLHQRR
jgi:hypothetical protein